MTHPDASANWIDRAVAFVSPASGLRRRRARMLLSAYKSASTSRLRNNWILPGAGSDATPDQWDLDTLRERSRDANRNDPVASGATDTLQVNVVGSGLHPQARIRADRLGISPEKAEELNRQAEYAWQLFTPTADAGNRLDFDEIQFLTLRKVVEDGEALVIPTWAAEPWRPFGRCLEMAESDRLATPYRADDKIVQGVELGSRGEPLAYYVRKAGTANDFTRIAARDNKGRPRFLHIYRTVRPGQVRGIPYFAPVLTYFKDMADYLEAEVVAARVAACLAVFVTKADPMATAIGLSDDTETGTSARIQGIEPGMVNYLNVGEGIQTVDPKRPGETFPAFMETVLRLIGVSLGLPYELLIKDFSKTNYSSARAALLEGRRMFMQWRNWLSRKLCQPIYDLVLEEAFLKGMFDAVDFYSKKPEYCRAMWIGGGWGWVDPVKEVEAARLAIDYGLSTLAEETATQGRDWEEVLEQQKRERDRAAELGLAFESQTGLGKGDDNAESEKE